MKKLLFLFISLFILTTGCNKPSKAIFLNKEVSLSEKALSKTRSAIIHSLIDPENASVSDLEVLYESDNMVVISCHVTANNSFGGRARNTFEYYYTKDDRQRLVNLNEKTYGREFRSARIYADGKMEKGDGTYGFYIEDYIESMIFGF